MKARALLAALAVLFTLQVGAVNVASAAARTVAKPAATKAKPAPRKAATRTSVAKKVVKKKAVASKTTVKKKSLAGKTATKKRVVKKIAARPVARHKPVNAARAAKASAALAAAAYTVPGAANDAETPLELDANGRPVLGSSAFYVVNQRTGEVLLERNGAAVLPIASITKLMTAMVVLDAGQSMSQILQIGEGDIDQLKGTGSRLSMGTRLTREELLHLALMSSENRAASALARHYPGGERAFIEAMNVKARLLGLWNTRFHDATGLDPSNVSSPRDLSRLVAASASYPLIREFSTAHERYVAVGGRMLRFGNTNGLVRSPEWAISVSKTGYISEAGRCLVMQTWLHQDPVVMVLMDSYGRYTRTADAKRVRRWLEQTLPQRLAAASGTGG